MFNIYIRTYRSYIRYRNIINNNKLFIYIKSTFISIPLRKSFTIPFNNINNIIKKIICHFFRFY